MYIFQHFFLFKQYSLSVLFLFWRVVKVSRDGASANSTLLVGEGNASLTMKKLKVSDEGTYICTISSGPFQTQQIVQLNIMRECLASIWTVKCYWSWDYCICESLKLYKLNYCGCCSVGLMPCMSVSFRSPQRFFHTKQNSFSWWVTTKIELSLWALLPSWCTGVYFPAVSTLEWFIYRLI